MQVSKCCNAFCTVALCGICSLMKTGWHVTGCVTGDQPHRGRHHQPMTLQIEQYLDNWQLACPFIPCTKLCSCSVSDQPVSLLAWEAAQHHPLVSRASWHEPLLLHNSAVLIRPINASRHEGLSVKENNMAACFFSCLVPILPCHIYAEGRPATTAGGARARVYVSSTPPVFGTNGKLLVVSHAVLDCTALSCTLYCTILYCT
jgi:hypothetical protein